MLVHQNIYVTMYILSFGVLPIHINYLHSNSHCYSGISGYIKIMKTKIKKWANSHEIRLSPAMLKHHLNANSSSHIKGEVNQTWHRADEMHQYA